MTLKTPYDNQLEKIETFNYLPWIGNSFDSSRIQIIGDSHYDDGDGWLPGNKYATRQLINNQGLNSDQPQFSKAPFLRIVEKLVSNKELITPYERTSFWNNVSFLNLSQRLLPTIKERPTNNDFDNGWETFLNYILITKPKICIKLGLDGVGRLGYYLNNHQTEWERNVNEFYQRPYIINLKNNDYQTKIVFINHPTGSRGFDCSKWTEIIHKEFPDLQAFLNGKN